MEKKIQKGKVLLTGSAGFIGFHLTGRLIQEGFNVTGIDIINDYYDVNYKYQRLEKHGIEENKIEKNNYTQSTIHSNYQFIKADLADHNFIIDLMESEQFEVVIHLAAQAGVRYSLTNPLAYTHSNINGFLSVLEGSRHTQVEHFIYASSSSVYGLNTIMPLSENVSAEHPLALYGATKKANEMMAHSYSHLFGIPTTGLRFFTVYGPWGRPDMALFLFADAITKNKPIKVFNNGNMIRDFTYIDDVVESISRLINKPATANDNWTSKPEPNTSSAPYQIFNIGNSNPTPLMDYIYSLENELGKKAMKEFLPMQKGDVPATHADAMNLENYINFRPETTISEGIKSFVEWYKRTH